jgi:ribose 5-phosphate isomerase B
MTERTVYLGSDHGGHGLKQQLAAWLREQGHAVSDFGCHSTQAVDWPDFALLVAQAVAGNRAAGGDGVGIMIDSIGQASAMACNKVPGIRAVAGFEPFAVHSSREHNDANVLCLGGQVLGFGMAKHLVGLWLDTPYAGGRHQARLDKLLAIEQRFMRG